MAQLAGRGKRWSIGGIWASPSSGFYSNAPGAAADEALRGRHAFGSILSTMSRTRAIFVLTIFAALFFALTTDSYFLLSRHAEGWLPLTLAPVVAVAITFCALASGVKKKSLSQFKRVKPSEPADFSQFPLFDTAFFATNTAALQELGFVQSGDYSRELGFPIISRVLHQPEHCFLAEICQVLVPGDPKPLHWVAIWSYFSGGNLLTANPMPASHFGPIASVDSGPSGRSRDDFEGLGYSLGTSNGPGNWLAAMYRHPHGLAERLEGADPGHLLERHLGMRAKMALRLGTSWDCGDLLPCFFAAQRRLTAVTFQRVQRIPAPLLISRVWLCRNQSVYWGDLGEL